MPQIHIREALLLTVFLTVTGVVHTWAYEDERIAEAEVLSAKAKHFAGIVAQCMNGADILWHEPHSGMEMATHCRTVEMGRMR